jgi:hypothetical protein
MHIENSNKCQLIFILFIRLLYIKVMMNLIYKIFLPIIFIPHNLTLTLLKVLSLTINDVIANIVHAKIYSNVAPYMSL